MIEFIQSSKKQMSNCHKSIIIQHCIIIIYQSIERIQIIKLMNHKWGHNGKPTPKYNLLLTPYSPYHRILLKYNHLIDLY